MTSFISTSFDHIHDIDDTLTLHCCFIKLAEACNFQTFSFYFIYILNQDEVASLQAKVVALEEELRKSKQEAVDYQNLTQQLEKVYECHRLITIRRMFSKS